MELSVEDQQTLQRAEGWLELHLPGAAGEELDEIDPGMRAHPAVLRLRYSVHAALKRWDLALAIASRLQQQLPDDPYGGVHAAVALYRLGRTPEAKELSLALAPRFPKDWSIPYNLACYCAQLGRLEECKEWFTKAMAIDKETIQPLAIKDTDLKPLWDSMSGTIWKRTD